jgi:hypothetical protein
MVMMHQEILGFMKSNWNLPGGSIRLIHDFPLHFLDEKSNKQERMGNLMPQRHIGTHQLAKEMVLVSGKILNPILDICLLYNSNQNNKFDRSHLPR